MSRFDDLLGKRLGPMRSLVDRTAKPDAEPIDPAALFYRRAVGVEARIRLGDSWSEVELSGASGDRQPWDREAGLMILALTRWTHAEQIPLRPKDLWRAVEQDLLFWSRQAPPVML